MTATPEQRREAWLALVGQMERQLLATRENAKASEKMAQALIADGCAWPSMTTPEDWEATAWAAGRLLEGLKGLPVPEVPRDDETGQGDLLTLVPSTLWEALDHHQASTPGEKPGDDGSALGPVCWSWGCVWPHAVPDIGKIRTTDQPGLVTCQACLAQPGGLS